mmetsp:Transcript_3793/g.6478  ORF Transcript_3793/g.6478 Transcript_3793/m.6478 type:complete len:263 (-) Transcript_3793:1336-2124(-)
MPAAASVALRPAPATTRVGGASRSASASAASASAAAAAVAAAPASVSQRREKSRGMKSLGPGRASSGWPRGPPPHRAASSAVKGTSLCCVPYQCSSAQPSAAACSRKELLTTCSWQLAGVRAAANFCRTSGRQSSNRDGPEKTSSGGYPLSSWPDKPEAKPDGSPCSRKRNWKLAIAAISSKTHCCGAVATISRTMLIFSQTRSSTSSRCSMPLSVSDMPTLTTAPSSPRKAEPAVSPLIHPRLFSSACRLPGPSWPIRWHR